MVINFSDNEKKYIVMEKGNWHITDDCPENIKEKLKKKLEMLNYASQSNR